MKPALDTLKILRNHYELMPVLTRDTQEGGIKILPHLAYFNITLENPPPEQWNAEDKAQLTTNLAVKLLRNARDGALTNSAADIQSISAELCNPEEHLDHLYDFTHLLIQLDPQHSMVSHDKDINMGIAAILTEHQKMLKTVIEEPNCLANIQRKYRPQTQPGPITEYIDSGAYATREDINMPLDTQGICDKINEYLETKSLEEFEALNTAYYVAENRSAGMGR